MRTREGLRSNISIDGLRSALHPLGIVHDRTSAAPPPPIGIVRNISIQNLTAVNAGPIGCSVSGLPGHPVEDIRLGSIRITSAGGGTAEDAAKDKPEFADRNPESTAWGTLPPYA